MQISLKMLMVNVIKGHQSQRGMGGAKLVNVFLKTDARCHTDSFVAVSKKYAFRRSLVSHIFYILLNDLIELPCVYKMLYRVARRNKFFLKKMFTLRRYLRTDTF